ncbi:uncharacterized protein LOC110860264 [Folsomia candida]|uniref:Death domain-containing protein n=1 Tax=Folsomia candida TaxID=158441 RepID=A0A226DA27_FOLCA|nr:uncharacterized protein LOC110860264 [Folsomia candida]OXA41106.1 hypothetical protein Fcan01_24129 [Folsomia candida]
MADSTDFTVRELYLQHSDAKKLANIIVEDMYLIKNWEQLCVPFNVNNSQKLLWRRHLDMGVISYHRVIEQLLEEWLSYRRTLNDLTHLLDKEGFRLTAENIKDRFILDSNQQA